jgi:hypothetical protein
MNAPSSRKPISSSTNGRVSDRDVRSVRKPTPLNVVSGIARRVLEVPTLWTRRSDSLDFPAIAVWLLKRALLAAFEAGRRYGRGYPGDAVIESFERQLRTMNRRCAPLIGELAKQVGRREWQVTELYWEHLAELKSHLGAEMANQCGDGEADRQSFLAMCEAWMADKLSNRNGRLWVTSVLVMRGRHAGAEWIRKQLAQDTSD